MYKMILQKLKLIRIPIVSTFSSKMDLLALHNNLDHRWKRQFLQRRIDSWPTGQQDVHPWKCLPKYLTLKCFFKFISLLFPLKINNKEWYLNLIF